MKPPAYYKGKEQTYLKHYFLERYLETVAFHIGYSYRSFVYVDCFSGPWRSDDEELADTSIRIAIDKLNYVRDALAARQRFPNIRAIFVEKDQPLLKRSSQLWNNIGARSRQQPFSERLKTTFPPSSTMSPAVSHSC